MGRTKLNPQRQSRICLISNRPTFSYLKEVTREKLVKRNDRISSPLLATPPEEEVRILDDWGVSEDDHVDSVTQSPQVVLLLEDNSSEKPTINFVISSNNDDKVSTDFSIDTSWCAASFVLDSTAIYHELRMLSIYSNSSSNRQIKIVDRNSVAILLSLCFLLCRNSSDDNSKQQYVTTSNSNISTTTNTSSNAHSIRSNLINIREKEIKPILTAYSQGLISVVAILSLADNNNTNIDSDLCCYSCPRSVQVQIRLTDDALKRCHPNTMSSLLSTTRLSSISTAALLTMRQTLAILFPNSIISDVVSTSTGSRLKNESSETATSRINTAITAKMIYRAVDNMHYNDNYDNIISNHASIENNKIPGLIPTLRPYQEAAVNWMIRRENQREEDEPQSWKVCWVILTCEANINNVQPLHNVHGSPDHNHNYSRNQQCSCYYNPFTGWICTTIEAAKHATLTATSSSSPNLKDSDISIQGGILAESMGLGKTVEVIACILRNKCPFSHNLLPKFNDFEIVETELSSHSNTTNSPSLTDCPVFAALTTSNTTEATTTTVCQDKNKSSISDKDGQQQQCHKPGENSFVTTKEGTCTHTVNTDSAHTAPLLINVEAYKTKTTKKETSFQQKVDHNDDGLICICGRADSFSGCLGWVRCEACKEFMHGSCAGFVSQEQKRNLVKGEIWCSATRCPCCVGVKHNSKTPIDSTATLIITPTAILDQWHREIRRHVSLDLKIIVYPGIREMCSGGKIPDLKYAHVTNLADADIILTSFQTLMGDLHHSRESLYEKVDSKQRNLRKRKRYRVLPSPLPSIRFWRCCLDEAQRVEAPTAASAKMALNLTAINKWCVTGTPVGRGKLDDLFGLILFLGLPPFNERRWFKHCFQSSHRGAIDRIRFMLHDVFWRSTKANSNVREQMGIPEQVEHKTFLKFSTIEKHFYQKQLEETIMAATQVTQDYENGKGRKHVKGDEQLLSIHLQRLRAACCHPQVGSSGLGRLGSTRMTSLASGVLTMDQILDRLIDDAKTKCEESQRIAVMHSNAIASLIRLKVDARHFGNVQNLDMNLSDQELLQQCAQVYIESLDLTKKNASPCEAVGESTVTGCIGFLSPGSIVRGGKATLQWQVKLQAIASISRANDDAPIRALWARFDFEGPAKKLTAVKMRTLTNLPDGYHPEYVKTLLPKKCLLQVSDAAVGGEFVDVCEFELPDKVNDSQATEWASIGGFRANKSRSWRIVIGSYHALNSSIDAAQYCQFDHYFVAVDVQLSEPEIGTDDLQRVHITYNATQVLSSIIELNSCSNSGNSATTDEIKQKLHQMRAETNKLEQLYLMSAIVVHRESRRQLELAVQNRNEIERSMSNLIRPTFNGDQSLAVENVCLWWSDFLSWCRVNHEKYSVEFDSIVHQTHDYLYGFEDALMRDHKIRLPEFRDLNGLYLVLQSRTQGHLSVKQSSTIIQKVLTLSEHPSESETFENSQCRNCRSDWGQFGPKCRHCKLEDELKMMDAQVNDYLCFLLLRCIGRSIREGNWTSSKSDSSYISSLREKAKLFLKWQDARKQEINSAKLFWKVHLNLLSDIDELNQCKSTMRLLRPGESFQSSLREGNVVSANEIQGLILDHEVKQAMALSQLKRDKNTLRYLRNQTLEGTDTTNSNNNGADDDAPTCVVCLCAFGDERAVLSCGHCFHYSPCLEQLVARSGGGSTISCPMRCNARTNKDQIMIASDKNKKDGSRSRRTVKGSWGTKVERLVGDLLDVIDIGEKSIVFSQWEDLLTIVEQALIANQIDYVKPKGQANVGVCAKRFRGGDIPVLILNVKCGAEGLSLVEATHVFMVEPLLHCGLDAQAINRVHRIGQTSKTHVHRYIIEDTIEVKIDMMRMEMQETHEEDEMGLVSRKSATISAGGIDGGFSATQLKEILK